MNLKSILAIGERFSILRDDPIFEELQQVSAYKSDALTSKMWILPDGKPVSLNGWHYRWILGNPKRVAKYGLDVSKMKDDEESVRKAALKAGFVRVNYEHRTGDLTIEGIKIKMHKKIKDAIFVIVMDNLSKLDRVNIVKFNDTITKVVSDKTATLFTLRDEADKLNELEKILD